MIMKKFKLDIKDKCGVEVCEGSILGILTSRQKGYQKGGKLIQRKVVFGKTNTDESTLTDYIGFWAVPIDCEDTAKEGFNYYDSVTSVQYLVDSQNAEVIGSVHDTGVTPNALS